VVVVRLTRSQLDQIIAQARAEAPNECCGVLFGRDHTVEEVFPGRNVSQTPKTRYVMDPEQVNTYVTLQDQRGWDLMIIYHSHPETEAKPSKTDKALAGYPDAHYLIVSLKDPDAPVWRAWRIVEKIAEDGKPLTDNDGSAVRVEVEEDVVVT
jgi:proteasome lid subunit RPN8/RPN11